MLTRHEAEEIMKIEGEVKGVSLQIDAGYVERKWGKEGLDRIKRKLAEVGFPIDFQKISALEWRPAGLRILSLLAIKEIFGLDDEGIKEMGRLAPIHSFIVKLLLKYAVTIRIGIKHLDEIWRKNHAIGEMSGEYQKGDKCLYVYLKNVKYHPVYCKFLEGFIEGTASFAISKNAECKEVTCPFNNGAYHTYVVRW
jgi:hypothetical protein